MGVKKTIKLYYYILQRALGAYPKTFLLLYKIFGKSGHLLVTKETDIAIEGFPRSCNTFAVVAFEYAQKRSLNIGHHLHVPAQIINACTYNIPALLLIREPEEAIVSLIIREPHIGLRTALKEYIRFYSPLVKYRDQLIVADFKDVTSDFGKIIETVNARYGTDYLLFNHCEEDVAAVFSLVQHYAIEESADGRLDETKVARPSADRSVTADQYLKELREEKFRPLLNMAKELYVNFSDDVIRI